MPTDLFLLALGMALLVAGGRAIVSGASQLASALGISELAIGLTVVAFGTSAPELAVNGLAALRGNTAIAFGNVVGSNIANIALVVGLSAMVRPVVIESAIVSREIPMMLLATIATVILGLDRIRGETEVYDRADGAMLLLLFSVFLYYSISEVIGKRRADPLVEAATQHSPAGGGAVGRNALLAVVGLGILVVGAQLTVSHAVSLAEALGVPRVVIALTVIAVGTSLPELATSLVAASKGHTSLALGNVVGSNIFNLLFVLGTTAAIRPVEVPSLGGDADLAVLGAFSLALLLLALRREARIGRGAGAGLGVGYLAYVVWRFSA
jgi:cation:H+ antiporter